VILLLLEIMHLLNFHTYHYVILIVFCIIHNSTIDDKYNKEKCKNELLKKELYESQSINSAELKYVNVHLFNLSL
jgi:hypothetical protein